MLSTIRKIFYILPKGDPFKVLLLFLLMMVAAGLEVLGIGMIPAFVSIVADPEYILSVAFLQPLYDWLGIATAEDLLIFGSIVLVGVFVIKSIYVICFSYVEAKFIFNRRYLVSHRLMSSYMQAPYTFHLKRNSAELLRNIAQEVNILINIVVTNCLMLTKEMVMVISILVFLFIMEPLITLGVILFTGLGAGTFLLMTQKKVKQFGIEEQGHRRNMIKAINQGLGGIKDARVLNREAEFIDKFRVEAFKSSRLLATNWFVMKIPKPVVETTAVVTMMLISAFMVWQGRPMATIIPILTLFAMATVRLMPSVQTISTMLTSLRYSIVAVNPLYDDLKSLENYRKHFLADRKNKGQLELKREIEAVDLHFSYPESDEQALNGISFTVPYGKAVAFVGSSGAGKTTVVDLLLGLMEPTSGRVMVDGKNIQDHLSAWQRNIGYIPQSIYLSDETLRNNVAYGVPEKEIDDTNVMQALELAQLKELIEKLPQGLDTVVGENGTRLSGGQRQRVGIARALYHNPQVLVMDEATSALDNITEKEITRAIDALKGERTVIMIAHRLTTVQNCDHLYLLKDGKVVDNGTYDELINKNREFRKMALAD